MPNIVTSPDMLLPIPVVSIDPGPDWAQNINASLAIIDSHNHSPGQGVQIGPNGMNINTDLPFNGNNATLLRSVRFSPQPSPISGPADLGSLYEAGVDLYYNDGVGNQIRITQSGAVVGSPGTITGLPSGTASASFSGSTFTFESATATPASMAIGPIILGYPTANPKTITISPTAGQPVSYDLNLPAAAPTGGQVLISDNSGNLTWLPGFQVSGSFTVSFTGVLSAPITNTWYYIVSNNIVTISSGASGQAMTKDVSASAITVSGFPSTLLPSSSTLYAAMYLSVNGGGTYLPAALVLTSTGGSLYKDIAQNVIPGGSSCIISPTNFSYLVRP